MKGDALAFSNTNSALLTPVFESTNRRRVFITNQKWEAENLSGCCEYDQNYIKCPRLLLLNVYTTKQIQKGYELK